jgi:hypothetical protein
MMEKGTAAREDAICWCHCHVCWVSKQGIAELIEKEIEQSDMSNKR